MSEDVGDPRVYFAAERTLLAWLRTGIGVMAFGFVVARFSLIIRLASGADSAIAPSRLTPFIGAMLVFLGTVATAGGTLQYRRYCRRLRPVDLPAQRVPLLPFYLAWSLVVLGLLLTMVLLG